MFWAQKTILGIKWCYISINPIEILDFHGEFESFNVNKQLYDKNTVYKQNTVEKIKMFSFEL